ncbi:outer membrane protein [Brevundimonas sp. Root1423]|uniref:outer membrane protein n=1 Tax=Brevundimonas sp. Root1423 TaxID=1736462 RepID=UPI0006FD1FA0|nr:outer membrane beta-barrel protein [Brevundimonas sp. Root1423]KQY89722.1 porin [Brevundimonas sp. Root1423]
MYRTLSAASLAVLLAGVAAPALAQSAPDWTGPYIGVYGGVVENNEEAGEGLVFDRDFDGQFDDTVVLNGTTNDAFSPGSCDGAATAQAAGGGCDIDPTGVDGSIRAGYDMQLGPLVVGLVGELSAVDLEDSVTGFSTTPAAYVFTRQVDQMAAIRARVGFPVGRALYYATAGAAKAKVENSFRTTNTANSFTETVNEDDADGYQLGAGVEWKLARNLSVTGEYLYSNLQPGDYVVRVGQGTAPATNPFILAPNTAGTDMMRSNDDLELHALRIGMNVRF